MKKKNKIQQVASLLICLLIVSSLAIVKQGKWMGREVNIKKQNAVRVDNDTIKTLNGGKTIVVETKLLASDIMGYGGNVPLEIVVEEGRIVDIKALKNDETPEFFEQAASLLKQWKGKTVAEASGMKVDAVSGATFSSKAIIANMERGLRYLQGSAVYASTESKNSTFDSSAKNLAGIIVVLMAAILPMFVKNKKYHLVQLVLNVVVLGFWCGTFLSYSSLIGVAAQGIDIMAMLVLTVMLIVGFVYPLFGKKSFYCAHVCPFGSMQQLAGKCVPYKIRLGQKTLRRLQMFRKLLWAALMVCIWGGVWSQWTDYELFSAFIFQSASWVVIAMAIVFVLLSLIVTRPYCRFVCPMGTLLDFSQKSIGKWW